jgi:hypothetical protein
MSSATTAGRVPSKSIYDTSVYVNAIRSRTYYESILPHFARTLPTTYFCAVVAQELKAGCHTLAARERVGCITNEWLSGGEERLRLPVPLPRLFQKHAPEGQEQVQLGHIPAHAWPFDACG